MEQLEELTRCPEGCPSLFLPESFSSDPYDDLRELLKRGVLFRGSHLPRNLRQGRPSKRLPESNSASVEYSMFLLEKT